MVRQHGNVFKVMHWLMALGILGAVGTAMTFNALGMSPLKFQVMSWHKWIGVVVLLLWVPRLIASKKGYQAVTTQSWEDTLAHLVHLALYGLMAVVPLLGIAMSQAKGFPVVLFGVWTVPVIPGVPSSAGEGLAEAHGIAAWTLVALILLHVAGAVKRQMTGEKVISQMASVTRKDEQ